jgi:hypothetical protein
MSNTQALAPNQGAGKTEDEGEIRLFGPEAFVGMRRGAR